MEPVLGNWAKQTKRGTNFGSGRVFYSSSRAILARLIHTARGWQQKGSESRTIPAKMAGLCAEHSLRHWVNIQRQVLEQACAEPLDSDRAHYGVICAQ